MTNSIVNIESVTNSSFGTGFVVHSDEKGVYILTCNHVVEEVVNPVVENVLAKVVAIGEFIDMAVLYVPKLHLDALPLEKENTDNLDVSVIGFSQFNKSSIQKKHIDATVYKEHIELHIKEEDVSYNLRKIKAKDGFNFDRGNSGSPVICLESNKVIAMISNKEGSNIAYAINIEYIKEIWEEIPLSLFNESNDFTGVTSLLNESIQTSNESNSKFGKYLMVALLIFSIGFYLLLLNGKSQEHGSKNKTINYESGDIYKGSVKKEHGEYVPSGKGTYIYFNGDKYIGLFQKGRFHGRGRLFYNNGNKYVGMFIDGMPEGKGTAYYHTNDKYIGLFHDGRRNGTGTFYYTDGGRCMGKFKDDLPTGKILCSLPKGLKAELFYENGLPQGDILLTDPSGNTHNLDSSEFSIDFNNDEMFMIKLYG